MAQAVCAGGAKVWILDLSHECARDLWSAVLPFAFAAVASVARLVHVRSPFVDFLTLSEAEALADAGDRVLSAEVPKHASPVPIWRSVLLAWLALFEALVWLGAFARQLYIQPVHLWDAVRLLLISLSWFYAALRPMLAPTATPPYDLLTLYTLQFIAGVLSLGNILFEHAIGGVPLQPLVLAAHIANVIAVVVLLTVVLNMPLAVPSSKVKKEDIGKSVSPEDYTSLWGWMSFRWVTPLISRGTYATLFETDVWALSPTMQTRPLYIKFGATKRATLLRRLWAANSLDLFVDFLLSYVGIMFNYAGPFFLKRILDTLDTSTPPDARHRALAFVYAFLTFASALCKAEADVQHLWFGRRAIGRIRSELMAAIYDKALKRKDFSGIVSKDAGRRAARPEDGKADDPKAGADIGKIVNLMAGDTMKIADVAGNSYMIYGAPFELLIASLFLYQLLGWSAFTGFVVIVVGWPLNNFVAKRTMRISRGVSNARDKRMGVLNELISSVKFIKFFAWEERWIQRVLDAREVEMEWMVKARVNSVLFSLIWIVSPILISATSFFVYVVQGNQLTIGTAFTAIALFAMVKNPLNTIPAWVVEILHAKVAMDRISMYLGEDEVDEQVSTLKRGRVPPTDADAGLGIDHGSFKWNEVEEKDMYYTPKAAASTTPSERGETATVVGSEAGGEADHRFELRDISVVFPEGALTVVTGPTASGKTALLMALLGELTTLEGRIIMSKNPSKVDAHGLAHTISYAAQSPWLRHQSIKDNILFGFPLDEERYRSVVECCALQTDLDILEDGDLTEIGARGVSLSGGQKARVALARAVYAPTKYILLDDPLSAVDSHTARFLFDRLLCGPLLAHRTILVTHHVELVLPGAYYLVRMLDGRIDTQGTLKELRERGVLDDIAQDESVDAHKEAQEVEAAEQQINAEIDADAAAPNVAETVNPVEQVKKARKFIEEEKRETASVKWSIYKIYLKASSYWTWVILCILILLWQFLSVAEKFWIKIWGEAYGDSNTTSSYAFSLFSRPHHEMVMDDTFTHFVQLHAVFPSMTTLGIHLPSAQEHPLFYIGIYTAIALFACLLSIAAVITQYTGALRASRVLFKRLLVSVVRATMRWHDVTPQGRMLNRFSKDIETVDFSLATDLHFVNSYLASFFASVITVIVIFPLFIFPASVLGFFYRRAAFGYLNTGRDLRRMESNSRSPIFANFSELLEGIVTVRAFSVEQVFLDDLYTKIDLTIKMWFSFWMTNRWLQLYFDTLGAVAVLATTLFALSGYVQAGIAGVCITSAMTITFNSYWVCRSWTALELDLNSVERVVEYLDLPQEPPAIIEANRPPAYWPSSSSPNKNSMISVEDLVIRYAPELPAVLRGVSFNLRAKERVGLLGRTGSGKSTLAMSILRFADPTSGRIVIDGIDISTVGLHDLRSRITFIPQDATLFSGTLRDNLDPFGEYEDSECLDVLHRVQMLTDSQLQSQRTSREPSRPASPISREDTITSTTTTEIAAQTTVSLSTQVSPGGANFSQGQRQLIAMARALLRRSAIIVLDEATSSIDFAADAKIQATIREEFNDSLLLTIAHRLRTVIDYDRLLILDKGELAEFDTPLNLIHKEDGIFRNMCLKSGTFAELEAAARAKADREAASHLTQT